MRGLLWNVNLRGASPAGMRKMIFHQEYGSIFRVKNPPANSISAQCFKAGLPVFLTEGLPTRMARKGE
jgi:hypothetical protein